MATVRYTAARSASRSFAQMARRVRRRSRRLVKRVANVLGRVTAHDRETFYIAGHAEQGLVQQVMVVEFGGTEIGFVKPTSIFSQSAILDLTASLSGVVRVLLGWIAIIRWQEAAAAAA